MKLDKLKIGESATITRVSSQGIMRKRLLDMGLTPKTTVTLFKKAPMGDPIELTIRGYHLTMRIGDAAQIEVEKIVAVADSNDILPIISTDKIGEASAESGGQPLDAQKNIKPKAEKNDGVKAEAIINAKCAESVSGKAEQGNNAKKCKLCNIVDTVANKTKSFVAAIKKAINKEEK